MCYRVMTDQTIDLVKKGALFIRNIVNSGKQTPAPFDSASPVKKEKQPQPEKTCSTA